MTPSNSTRPVAWPLTVATAVVASVFRLIPHPWNCTPVGTLGLYAGGRLPWWAAWVLPLAVMAGTDYLLFAWFGESPYNKWVYASFLVYVLLGRLLTGTNSPWRIGSVAAVGSVQFYVITNFGVWYGASGHVAVLYPPNVAGLVACYVAGLPFLGYTLLGDLGFSAVLFGAHAWLSEPAAQPQGASEEARA